MSLRSPTTLSWWRKTSKYCEQRLRFRNAAKRLSFSTILERKSITGFITREAAFAKLHSVVDGKPGYSPAQLQEALASAKSARVEAIRQRTLTSPSGKAVIALFSRIGTFCPTGEVLDSLKGHQAKLQDVEFLILFPKDFTSNDVQNFKSNLKVSIPVALADPELANVWESFHLRYGELPINGALVAIDRGAISVLHGVDQLDSFLANAGNTNAKP